MESLARGLLTCVMRLWYNRGVSAGFAVWYVEPCVMEVFDDGRFIYGNSSLVDAPWFVIDKKSHAVLKGDGLYEIMAPSDRTRISSILHGLRTFQDWRGRRE